MPKDYCYACGATGKINGLICMTCGGLGVIDTPDSPGVPRPRPPTSAPLTGWRKLVGLLLLIAVVGATVVTYQNAPGDQNSKILSAVGTFILLGIPLLVLLFALQNPLGVVLLLAVAGLADWGLNDARISTTILRDGGDWIGWITDTVGRLVRGTV